MSVGHDRISSFLLSLCLHLAVLALALFWPAPEARVAKQHPTLSVSGFVTLGAPGKSSPVPKKINPALAQSTEHAQIIPKKVSQPPKNIDQPPVLPKKVQDIQKQQSEQLKAANIPIQEKTLPIKSLQNATIPPPKEDTTAQVKKASTSIADTRKKDPPSKNKTIPKDTVTEPGKEIAQPKKQKKDLVAEAVKEFKEKEKSQGQAKGSRKGSNTGTSRKSGLADQAALELESFFGSTGLDKEGFGPGGSGGDGIGIPGTYEEVIMQNIKRNWSLSHRADNKELSAKVFMRIAPDGTILEHRLIQPSGDLSFDNTLEHAIISTGIIDEAPPPHRLRGGDWTAVIEFIP